MSTSVSSNTVRLAMWDMCCFGATYEACTVTSLNGGDEPKRVNAACLIHGVTLFNME